MQIRGHVIVQLFVFYGPPFLVWSFSWHLCSSLSLLEQGSTILGALSCMVGQNTEQHDLVLWFGMRNLQGTIACTQGATLLEAGPFLARILH